MKAQILAIAVILYGGFTSMASAQTGAAIVSANGTSLIVESDGERVRYNLMSDDVVGLSLSAGDSITTDSETTAVLRLKRSGNGSAKIAEDTTVKIIAINNDNENVYQVLYGRARFIVSPLVGKEPDFWVTGRDLVVGARGTDFGYDVFYNRDFGDSERVSTVYVFDGEVEVYKYNRANIRSKVDLLGLTPFYLESDKMARYSSSIPDRPLAAEDIDPDIIAYWKNNPKVNVVEETPPAVVEEPPRVIFEEPPRVVVEELPKLEVPQENLDFVLAHKKIRSSTAGKVTIAVGVAILLTGGILDALYTPSVTPQIVPISMYAIGAASVLAGGSLLIFSLTKPTPLR